MRATNSMKTSQTYCSGFAKSIAQTHKLCHRPYCSGFHYVQFYPKTKKNPNPLQCVTKTHKKHLNDPQSMSPHLLQRVGQDSPKREVGYVTYPTAASQENQGISQQAKIQLLSPRPKQQCGNFRPLEAMGKGSLKALDVNNSSFQNNLLECLPGTS